MDILGATLGLLATVGNAVIVIWFGPRAAARLSHKLHHQQRERDDRQGLRQRVFTTLMQERATPQSAEAIKAFNLIDTAFADDAEVRTAWATLLAASNPGASNPDSWASEAERAAQHRVLLERMTVALGLEAQLSAPDFARVYAPQDPQRARAG